MARPKKDNADYFSHDADMRNDLKVKALRNRFGLDGYAIWNMLLEVLTDSTHFEYEWTEISKELMAADFGIETAKLDEIIVYATKLNLLTLNFDANVIYCQKLRDRFNGLLSKRERERNPVIDNDNPKETPLSTPINPQSKKKYSRVKKSKLDESKFKLYAKVCSLFDDKIDKKNWIDAYDKLIRLDGYTEERILEIVTEFRKDGNWWKDNGNFQSLVKLRKTNDEEIKYIDLFDAKMPKAKNANLGFGEFVNSEGNRTYGTSGVIVPNDAPPRPSNQHIWSKNEAKWKIQ